MNIITTNGVGRPKLAATTYVPPPEPQICTAAQGSQKDQGGTCEVAPVLTPDQQGTLWDCSFYAAQA
ncbi:hypothetical protein NBRC116598_26080 [Pseudophaeobacter arcticus]|uniref:Uncharacterized protein n=1 Tax=Pseudophaeobacter arcticus TaxID=385492 RepID=A0ABQ0AMQ7_9RHOB